jgi:sulfur carrier protein ThiS
MALERAVEVAVVLVQPTGSSLREQALRLLARNREVMAHGVRHRATATLAAAHLRLRPEVDLHVMEPRFSSRTEVPEDVDVRQLITNFGITANAIAVVVNVEQVIKDTPH